MSEQSVDERIARKVMSWETRATPDGLVQRKLEPEEQEGFEGWIEVPDFEHSLDACALAEAEIEKRGLAETYARELIHDLFLDLDPTDTAKLKAMAYATPAQRCAAMLKAVEASNG